MVPRGSAWTDKSWKFSRGEGGKMRLQERKLFEGRGPGMGKAGQVRRDVRVLLSAPLITIQSLSLGTRDCQIHSISSLSHLLLSESHCKDALLHPPLQR